MAIPTDMRAIALDSFGGAEKLKVHTLPVPSVGPGEVLIRMEYAGVGVWDPYEREGGFDELVQQMTGRPTKFPLVIGSDGAGTVAAVGPGVTQPKVGDKVYAPSFLNPKGGMYAEYAVANADIAVPIPKGLTAEAAAVFGGDAGTALRGLHDVLKVTAGEHVLIFGAGGGLGHFAVQLAKRLGARVLAVASGADGVALAQKIGADVAIDGRKEDVVAAIKRFAPGGLDAALFAAGGETANQALAQIKPNGRAAFPHGVMPEPKADGVEPKVYNGDCDAELLARLNRLVESGTTPFIVNVAKTFPLEQAAEAHRFLDQHYLGKVALKII